MERKLVITKIISAGMYQNGGGWTDWVFAQYEDGSVRKFFRQRPHLQAEFKWYEEEIILPEVMVEASDLAAAAGLLAGLNL